MLKLLKCLKSSIKFCCTILCGTTQTLKLHQTGTPGQKEHHNSKTSTGIVQQNFIEDFNVLNF
jgi:hypothetical protein